jgi:aminopeptidase
MRDPRSASLAQVLVRHSCRVEPGENVMIESFDAPSLFLRDLVREVAAAGGRPLLQLRSHALMRDLLRGSSEAQMQLQGEIDAFAMAKMQCYIGVRANTNISEWSDLPPEMVKLYQEHWWTPVHREIRVPKTKWVILRWPNDSMAQLAGMSTEAFEDFYFRVCTLDYGRMSEAMKPLERLLASTDRVRLVAPGTDLRFSVKGIPAIGCDGRTNIPDGEVFTAPVKDSIEGTIAFNTPTIYQGISQDRVTLRFEQGKIASAEGTDQKGLLSILDSDPGARYMGEFALGFNPHVTRPMRDILFDEKIAGSIHMAIGNSYEDAFNGNKSGVHWDLVLRMNPEDGGGQVYFDDVLIRENGRFLLPELAGLNPENLG